MADRSFVVLQEAGDSAVAEAAREQAQDVGLARRWRTRVLAADGRGRGRLLLHAAQYILGQAGTEQRFAARYPVEGGIRDGHDFRHIRNPAGSPKL